MRNLYDRLLVILRAAPTALTAVAVVAGILLDELPALPFDIPPAITTALAATVTVLAVATAIIRRVTPVLADARGLLPPPDGRPVTAAEARLARQLPPPPPR